MTLLALLFALPVSLAQTPETSVSVQPNRIGASNRATVRLSLTAPGPTSAIEWTTTLPDGVSPADPPRLKTTCMGMVSLDGQTLSHSIDRMAGSCVTELDITADAIGEYDLPTGLLTSSAGNAEGLATSLNVLASLPTVDLTAQPLVGPVGSVRSLEGTIASDSGRNSFSVNVELPTGMAFAEGMVPSFDCADNLFPAVPSNFTGGQSVFFSAFATPGSCVLSADVVLTEPGSGQAEMTVTLGNPAQTAIATMQAPARPGSAGLIVGPAGAVVPFSLTLRNRDRSQAITDLATTIDLATLLPGLTAAVLPPAGTCGASSTLTGTTELLVAGVSIQPGEDCVLPISVQIPAGAVVANYTTESSPISLMLGDTPTTWEPILVGASVTSDVTTDIAIRPSPVGAGQPGTLGFDITNGGEAISDYSVRLTVGEWLPGLQLDTTTADDCPDGASAQIVQDPIAPYVILSVPTVPANSTCSVDVPVTIPTDANHGERVIASLAPNGTVGGVNRGFSPARATATVVGSPTFTATVVDNRIAAGGSTTAVFTASLSEELALSATDLAFSITADDALVLGSAEVSPGCGGATLTTEPLGITGGTLASGTPCTVSIPVSVAADASRASLTIASDGLTAVIDGTTVQAGETTASTTISAGAFSVAIDNARPISQSEVVLTHTVTNDSGGPSTNSSYSVNLAQTLPGGTLTGGAVSSGCGASAAFTPAGSTFGIFTGLDIAEDTPCIFETTVVLPAQAPGEYAYAPSVFTLNIDGSTQVLAAAPVDYEVPTELLLSAAITPSTLLPLQTATVRYELANGGTNPDTAIGFTHDLSAIEGLIATNTPLMDVCGPGSSVVGTDMLTVSGGQLDPQTTCVFEVTLQAPASVPFGSAVDLSTSVVTSTRDGRQEQTPAAQLVLTFEAEICRTGFSSEGGLCVDVDECIGGNDNCSDLAVCTNTEGSFECACSDGYEGDGVLCSDTNECDMAPCADDADCTNSDGAFDCACPEGLDGDPFISCDPICGDGLVVDEACDDGNQDAGDGCGSDCVVEDGFACAGEPSVCAETCGDGVIDALEECDDGDDNGREQDCLADCTLAEPTDTDEPDPDGEGCSCTSAPSGAPWGLLLLAVASFGARRRQRR